MKHYCNDPYCEMCNPPVGEYIPHAGVIFISQEQLDTLLGKPDPVAANQEIEILERWYKLEAKGR